VYFNFKEIEIKALKKAKTIILKLEYRGEDKKFLKIKIQIYTPL
jgi:hypothetical protein